MGLRAVIVGLETANEEELELYNKKAVKPLTKRAIEVLAKYNVDCYGTLILESTGMMKILTTYSGG